MMTLEKNRELNSFEKERIIRDAPDYIVDSNEEIQELYVISEWVREERDLSPKRYCEFVVNAGTEKEHTLEIDFQQTVNPGAVVKTAGGNITDVRSINAKRLAYLKLDHIYQRSLQTLNKARGAKSCRPKNIVDYTAPIMEMFGKFYTITDVNRVMAKEYKIKVPESELQKFFVDHRDLITKRRAEYVLQNKDFRVATETGRLEVLNRMLVDIEIKNRSAGGSNADYCNLILKIIEQARKEVKGNEVKMTIDGRIDINATLHAEQNIVAVMSKMSINALVIGLTAAKAGLNPAVFIGQLSHSWYGQFNGFNGNVMDAANISLPSALIKQYDWGQLEQESKNFIEEFTPITEIMVNSDVELNAQGEERRKILLEKIRSMKAAKSIEGDKATLMLMDNVVLKDLNENGMIFTPEQVVSEEPEGEFEIDYNATKGKDSQPRGMRIKGAIGESIARHAAAKEEGVVDVAKVLRASAKRKAERRKIAEQKKKELIKKRIEDYKEKKRENLAERSIAFRSARAERHAKKNKKEETE